MKKINIFLILSVFVLFLLCFAAFAKEGSSEQGKNDDLESSEKVGASGSDAPKPMLLGSDDSEKETDEIKNKLKIANQQKSEGELKQNNSCILIV